MKKFLSQSIIFLSFYFFIFSKTVAQSVGINATGALPNAAAILHVDAGTSTTTGLLVTGTYNATGTVPDLGGGSRLMFYPAKAAFRAGQVDGTGWNNVNVGEYSTAMGYNPVASGTSSIAIGQNSLASGTASTAIGYNNLASGASSTALGRFTSATGSYATALGVNSTASGLASSAFGDNTIASGTSSTSMGKNTTASGYISTALGENTIASGSNSTAMGSSVSATRTGSFIIGDQLGTGTSSSADNQMTMRFSGGFRMFANSTATTGVFLTANGNAWVSTSDRNRKENFESLDGEDVLKKMSKIEFTSWNYKQQDPKVYRHYGIMAQDFYKAFGHDRFGTIGNDTTVNPIDMIGIDMTAIRALEKRTADLKNENESLKVTVSELQKKFTEQQKLLEQILNSTNKPQKTTVFSKP